MCSTSLTDFQARYLTESLDVSGYLNNSKVRPSRMIFPLVFELSTTYNIVCSYKIYLHNMHIHVYLPRFGFFCLLSRQHVRSDFSLCAVPAFCSLELRLKLKHFCSVSATEKHPHAFISVSDISHKHIQLLLVELGPCRNTTSTHHVSPGDP